MVVMAWTTALRSGVFWNLEIRTLMAAIKQSRNKHIKRIRVASANQLKSGDLSIKTSNRNEAEALKQFTND